MAYEHLYTNHPVAKELTYAGKTETVYFKRLTAGQRLLLKQGQKGTVKAGETSFDVDLGDVDARNHKMLAFSNCTADGKAVFKTARDVGEIPEDLCSALILLMLEVIAEPDEGNG